MRFISTEGRAPAVDLPTAVLRALAPDGGLYVPERVDALSESALYGFHGASSYEISLALARHLSSDEALPLERIVRRSLDFPIPLRPLTDRVFVLELFHGPSLAFKDVGARFLAELLDHVRQRESRSERSAAGRGEPADLAVVVATSGDTGAAVGSAFHGRERAQVFVLYPDGQVSARQEHLIASLGGNVHALSVPGSFDDCQRLVKAILGDDSLRRRTLLTGANSINVGRWLPQIFYYFHAWAQLRETAQPIVVSVPSGNLGNLSAGLMARHLGLPIARFVAGTNANDALARLLAEGRYEPRPSVRTISNAMDVGDPSNLARILHLYDGDLERLRADLSARSYSDDETRACIARVFESGEYILDPHSAVGMLALEEELAAQPDAVGILLATAHPAKFSEVVEPLIGREVPLPAALRSALKRQRSVVALRRADSDALREIIDRALG